MAMSERHCGHAVLMCDMMNERGPTASQPKLNEGMSQVAGDLALERRGLPGVYPSYMAGWNGWARSPHLAFSRRMTVAVSEPIAATPC